MAKRYAVSVGVLGVAIVVAAWASMRMARQTQTPAATPTAAAEAWTAKTPDGQPDLQGMWLNYDSTPFERREPRLRGADQNDPVNGPWILGGSRAADENDSVRRAQQGTGYGTEWVLLTRPPEKARPSMVVDPPDGKVPIRASALQQRGYDAMHMEDSWVHHTTWERCITRGVPGGMFPARYNNAYQIVQGPGYVAIMYEMIHEPRIIPVDGSPHLAQNVRLWNGDSRGRWEGNTLVVDVTNYNDKGNIGTSGQPLVQSDLSGPIRGVRQSEAMHVIERFTRVSADRINYEVTIDDPKVFTKPWTVAMPLTRDDTYQIPEYACHEGNYAMINILSGGRAKEKAADTANTKGK